MRLSARGRLGILSVCLASMALPVAALPVAALPSAALPSAAAPEWRILPPVPLPTDSGAMDSVQAFAPDDVWVGGDSRRFREGSVVLEAQVRHWDGHRWTATPLENPMNSSVSDLDGVASDDMWAVNGAKDASPGRPNVQHWDGTKWTPTPVPDDVQDVYAVETVAGDDVWAVGDPGAVVHWDGRAWSRVSLPPEFAATTFHDVTATAPDDVWAVGGWRDDQGLTHPLVVHWDGQKWTKIDVPPTQDDDEDGRHASTVAATNGQVWVGTGPASTSGILVPITFHIDAAGITSTPILQADSVMLSDMTVVGDSVRLAVHNYVRAPVLEWRGNEWTPMPAPPLKKDSYMISGLASVPGTNEMWAVGYQHAIQGSPPDTLFSPMAARLR